MSLRREHHLNLTQRGRIGRTGRHVRVALPFFMFVSVALMILSQINHSAISGVRSSLANWVDPVLQIAMVPFEPLRRASQNLADQVDMTDELERLRNENRKLANWEWRARQLERRLAELEKIARTVPEQKIDFATSRVIGDSSGAFRRSIIIDAGSLQKITANYPVINGDGLVGRIHEIGSNTSRVLLLTDLESRVPVRVGDEMVRAIMAGDGGSEPRLLYVEPGARMKDGQDVWTSGAGGSFPVGLRIGTVKLTSSGPRVDVRAKLDKLQYVSVLFYENPANNLGRMKRPNAEHRNNRVYLPRDLMHEGSRDALIASEKPVKTLPPDN